MILAINAGNSTIDFGIFENDKLVLQFSHSTSISSSSDEIGIFLRSLLRENDIELNKIERIGCSSVIPSENHSIAHACKKYIYKDILFIQGGIKTGLKLRYSNPKEIGADLIAAAMGAVNLYSEKNVIVIDMGTVTTVEPVSKNREFLGGSILPGLKVSADAIANSAANLIPVGIEKPEHICGTTTAEAIQSGLYYGTAGALKELCYLYQKNVFHGEKSLVIGTGIFSKIFEEYNIFDEIVPELVLFGIKCALEIN